MRVMVWLRTDLRARDNLALFEASREATRGVVGLFVVSPGEWRAHDVAPARVEFMLRSLREVSGALAGLNIPVVVETAARADEVPGVVAAAAKRHGCDAVYWNREYEVNESRRDEATRAVLGKAGAAVREFDDQVLFPPGEVRTKEGRLYTVFTPFRKAVYGVMRERGVPRPVGMPGKQDAMPVRPGAVPEAVAGFESPVAGDLWPAGEGEAQRRLKAFVKRGLEEYKRRRDNPGVEGTSTLSPFLAAGAVSVRQCLAAAMGDAESPEDLGEGAACWVSELVWREFYIHVMAGYPRVCMHRAFLPATERVRWRDDPTGFEAWCLGRTGIPMVDAGMRQLEATGWMHNRVRMVTAMFLTKNLLIDWRRGEQWFMRHLVDGFLASNNGGWQWSASTGTDAAPYFRVFNPVSQGKKFDPEGEYVRRWVPELRGIEGAAVHEPWELPPLERGRIDYPGPIVDLKASRQRAIDAFAALA